MALGVGGPYQEIVCVNSVTLFAGDSPGIRLVHVSLGIFLVPSGQTCPTTILTQHCAFGSLYTPLATDVAGETEEYDGIVFWRVPFRYESSNNTHAAPSVNIDRTIPKLGAQDRKREILAAHLTSV